MNNLEVVQKLIVNKSGRLGLFVQKHAPEIMLTAGIGAVIVGTVMACKASTKVKEAIDESKEEIDAVKDTKLSQTVTDLADQQYQKKLVVAYTHTGLRFIKLYGPSLSLYTAGLVSILGAHGVMRQRQVALIAAYNVINESFNIYKKRVADRLGESEEYALRHGTTIEQVETIVDGKKKKMKVQTVTDKTQPSEYAKFFDEHSAYWEKDATMNKFFLSTKQNYLNDLLKIRGHVFLNEVYDELGLPRSRAGALVGWVQGHGDPFIDFGMYRFGNEDFINGYERAVLLDFNVCGVIYDLI